MTVGGRWKVMTNSVSENSRWFWIQLGQRWHRLCDIEDNPNKSFAVRIAVLISIAFSVKCALYTWADPKLSSLTLDGVPYPNKIYWMGHWVCLFAIPLFLGNYWLLSHLTQIIWKMLLPLCFTFLTVILVSLIDIHPPFPHPGLLHFMGHNFIAVLLAIWIRYSKDDILDYPAIRRSNEAGIEYIKQKIEFWRLVVVSGALGFFWMVPHIQQNLDKAAADLASRAIEQGIIREEFSVQIWVYISVAIVGPIYEGLAKIMRITDALLKIDDRLDQNKDSRYCD